jgi:hypothetical protein
MNALVSHLIWHHPVIDGWYIARVIPRLLPLVLANGFRHPRGYMTELVEERV